MIQTALSILQMTGKGALEYITPRPVEWPFSAGDFFALVLDEQMKAGGFPGNWCRLAVKLKGPLPPGIIIAQPGDELAPFNGPSMEKRGFLARPHWLDVPADGGRKGLYRKKRQPLFPEFGQVISPDPSDFSFIGMEKPPPVANLYIHQGAGGAELELRWHHALMDSRGAEIRLATLRDGLTIPQVYGVHFNRRKWWGPAKAPPKARDWKLMKNAGLYVQHLNRGKLQSASPAPPKKWRAKRDQPPNASHWIEQFTEEETRQLDERAEQAGAGINRSLYLLAGAALGVDRLLDLPASERLPMLVPVPVDLRPRGVTGPILSNPLSFHFFRLEPEERTSTKAAVGSLSLQLKTMVKNRQAEGFRQMLELMRYLPPKMVLGGMKRSSRGVFASFFFADLGMSFPYRITANNPTPPKEPHILGVPVESMAHIPPVGDPPGLGFAFWRFRGCQHVTVSWSSSVIQNNERAITLKDTLRKTLLVNQT